MSDRAFQDYYPDKFNICYGCGSQNPHGHQLKSRWDGDESVAYFTPEPYHTAVPGFVYGGLIASLIDCHSTGTAAAATYKAQGREMDTEPGLRFVTASLHVDYLAPTPIDTQLEIRATVEELTEKKVVVVSKLLAKNKVCAKGKVVAARMPDAMIKLID